jgi:transposase InsO family protein
MAPAIFNTDQGCQFTSLEFTGLLKAQGVQISMDRTGCWHDNVFVERLWKSIKCEEVYLYAYETASAAQQGLERYVLRFTTRPGHTGRLMFIRRMQCTLTTCPHGSRLRRVTSRGSTEGTKHSVQSSGATSDNKAISHPLWGECRAHPCRLTQRELILAGPAGMR